MNIPAEAVDEYPDHPDCYIDHHYVKVPTYVELRCYYCGRPEEKAMTPSRVVDRASDVPILDGTVVQIPRGKTLTRRDGRWEFSGSRVWVEDIMEHWLPVTVIHVPGE